MFQNSKKYKHFLLLTLLFVLFLPILSFAQGDNPGTEIVNPIGVDSIEGFIRAILDIIVKVGTPIAVLFIIYSGFLFVVARGNPEKINHAKEVFLYTIIGTVILLAAFSISKIIENTVKQISFYEVKNEISINES